MTRQAKQEVYNQILNERLLEGPAMETYHVIFYCGPIGKTAINNFASQQSQSQDPGVWSTKLPELFGNCLVDYKGKSVCPHSGVEEDLWDVTGDLPHPRKDTHDNSPAQASGNGAAQSAPATSSSGGKPLNDSKPTKKKLEEAILYMEHAVKVMAHNSGEEIPESVQHTLRWLKKPRTRKRKSSSAQAQA